MTQMYLLFPLYSNGSCWDALERIYYPETDNGVGNITEAVVSQNPWEGQESPLDLLKYPFPERQALQVIRGLCRALGVMHRSGSAHRDVKPHNIMLSFEDKRVGARSDENRATRAGEIPTLYPVLMDLGSVTDARMKVLTRRSALVAEDEAAVKTSAAYRAPELTQVQVDSELTEAVDMWAVGCTMFCLSFGRSPFETSREGVLKLAILNGKYDTPARNTNIRGVTYRWVSISLSSLLHTFFFPYFNLSLTLLLLLFLSFSPPVRSWNPPISVPVT